MQSYYIKAGKFISYRKNHKVERTSSIVHRVEKPTENRLIELGYKPQQITAILRNM